jgi:hypothetical protein
MKIHDLFDVHGIVILITGGASGIGLAYAQAMAQNGARIMLADINPETLAATMAAPRARLHRASRDVEADIRLVLMVAEHDFHRHSGSRGKIIGGHLGAQHRTDTLMVGIRTRHVVHDADLERFRGLRARKSRQRRYRGNADQKASSIKHDVLSRPRSFVDFLGECEHGILGVDIGGAEQLGAVQST